MSIESTQQTMSADDARRLTLQIKHTAQAVADGIETLVDLIEQAQTGNAYEALGYRSWTEYVEREFGDVLPRLEREPRLELERDLSRRGMSSRAIAPVVGVHDSTVARDVARAADAAGDGQPDIIGRDGKAYRRPSPAVDEFLEADDEMNARAYVRVFHKAIGRAFEPAKFDPARVAELAGDDVLDSLDNGITNLIHFRDEVRRLRGDPYPPAPVLQMPPRSV